MKLLKPISLAAACAAMLLSGCVTNPTTGQQQISKTALYGLGTQQISIV